jgi:hypothetical protein
MFSPGIYGPDMGSSGITFLYIWEISGIDLGHLSDPFQEMKISSLELFLHCGL